MIQIDNSLISPDLLQKIKNLGAEIEEFRATPLDPIALEKLQEHFRTHHIFHSAGIEGNRLTLQETALVLKEGIDISGKPLKDSIEVKNLGIAFDFLFQLVAEDNPITEFNIKQIHQLILGEEHTKNPGEYRDIGVIITGSEHKPPEPFEVSMKMMELFDWIKQNENENPIIVAAISHHELVNIHPFKDGNGRTARILLNLILLKKGFPICNIRRDDRPDYYNALSLGDEGIYEFIIEIVANNCSILFGEYIRLRDESHRLKDWTQRIGVKDHQNRLAKQKAEYELWLNKVNQIKLEFKQAVTMLNENIHTYYISFYEYSQVTFEKYQQLKDKGIAAGTNFFSIRFHNKETDRIVTTYMFRFYRSNFKYPLTPNVIPLELNYFSPEDDDFKFIGYYQYADQVALRAFFIDDKGELRTRFRNLNSDNPNPNWEDESSEMRLSETVQTFFEQIFNRLLGIR